MPIVPDAGRGEVERGRRAEPAGADEQRLRAEQLRLALGADLGDQQVAAVALLLLGGQDDRRLRSRGPAPFQAWKPPDIEATFV